MSSSGRTRADDDTMQTNEISSKDDVSTYAEYKLAFFTGIVLIRVLSVTVFILTLKASITSNTASFIFTFETTRDKVLL